MKLDWNKLGARERDEIVATQVMKWRRMTVGELFDLDPKDYREDYVKSLTDSWHAADGIEAVAPIDQECDCGCSHENFSPSTDIKDAWLVVERMRENGWQFELLALSIAQLHTAKFVNLATEDLWMAGAPTAPEAICLAALRAMGVEV